MGRPDAAVAAVEAGYSLEGDEESWLRRVAEAVRPVMDNGEGLFAYFVDLHVPPMQWFANRIELEASERGIGLARLGFEMMPAGGHSRAHLHGPPLKTTSASRSPFAMSPAEVEMATEIWRRFGVIEVMGFMVLASADRGVAFASVSTTPFDFSKATVERWSCVAAHVGAGLRLRRAIARGSDGGRGAVEAILDPSGRLHHAEPAAQSATARELLREAVVRQERARARRGRVDDSGALEGWRALEAGRWSLVDQFERGGRRYVVARHNDLAVPDPRTLTLRERQVAHLAAAGHSNKLIAYEMGLSLSTVATHLAAALRKLGLTGRGALVTALGPDAQG